MTYKVFCGLDVGTAEHHATALDLAGKRLHDKAIANDEAALRVLFGQLGEPGELVVVLDQPASIGALPVAVAQDMGIAVEYLPGLSMRRIADLHPGKAKTDARDACIIADAARTMPHALRSVDIAGPAMADLAVLVGHDDDLKDQVTAQTNRVRNLLLSVHPALERALGPNLAHPAVLALLAKYGGPAGLRKAGKTRIDTVLKKKAPRIHARLTEAIWAALDAQTVTVAGTSSVEAILPGMAAGLAGLIAQRAAVGAEVEKVLDAHRIAKVLTSMPAVGVRTCARILVEIGDGSSFPTAAHLASYAGLAPVTRRSGSSIRGEHPNRAGNKRLKNAMFMSAFSSLRCDPKSRAYYDRKRAAGKNTTPPSSASHDAAATSSTPCSATAPTTPNKHPQRLDKKIGTPPNALNVRLGIVVGGGA